VRVFPNDELHDDGGQSQNHNLGSENCRVAEPLANQVGGVDEGRSG
jgi:hypothetical protein